VSASTVSDAGIAGYRELVRHNANFRRLWFGQIISLLGDWFDLIASAALVSKLSGSGLAVGGLFVVRMLAPFLTSPLAGVAADRYNRKHLLVITDLSRAAVVMGFLLVRSPSQIWLLYTVTAVQLGLSGFFFPARNAILPDLVTPRELGAANTLSSSTWSAMLAFGAALGGIAAGQWGVYPAFVIDSLTFVASAVLIWGIDYRHDVSADSRAASLRAALGDYVDGLRYLKNNVDILVIACHKAAFALFVSGAFDVLQVRLAEKVFVIGKEGGTSLGLMYAMLGIGTGFAPMVARRYTGDRDRSLRSGLVAAYVLAMAGLMIMAPLLSFPLVLAGNLVRGIGNGIMWVFSTQLLLQLVPDRVRGRVFATEFAMFTLSYSIGASTSGWLLSQAGTGISSLLWLMAGLIVVPGVLWTLWVVRHPQVAPLPDQAGR
jgi:MFS family permease